MFNLTTKPVSAGELMKKEKKPINFVVEKFMSQGVHFLAGHPKSGKSWLSLWLALCVSNGNNLWGFKTNKSKVLYFCLEDTENRIQDRLEGMPGCDTDNLLFMYDAPNMDNGFDVFLKKIVKEEPEIKLVIVDTFQLIRGEQFAGNAYACEYAEMNYLKRLAKELDITIILVHHLRKMHDSSPQNMISGSTALAGGADTTFVLYTFPKKKGYGILYCKGRDTDIREIELRFGFGTHIWDKISDSVEDSDGMKMVEIITKLLDESGPFSGTATELCKLIKEVCDVEFTAPILGKKLADNKEFLKDFKINYESVRDMYQRTQKLWFDPDRIKNDSAEENSDTESNSETEFDDKTAEVDEDNTTVNFETDAEGDKEFIPFKMKIRSRYIKKKIFRSNVFICMCFACLVLAVFSSTFFVHVINSSYDRYSLESELVKSNVESCIARHISLMDNIIQDKDIVNYDLDRKKFTQIEYTTFVRLKIQNLIEGCSNIRAAAFVNTAGEIVSVKNKLVDSDFTTDEIKYNESVELGNTKDGSIFWYYREDIDSIVLLRRIRDYDSEIGISEHGYFIIYLDNDLFDRYGEKTNENLEIYILNADGIVISSNNYKSRGEVFDGIEKGYIFFKKSIREAQLSVVCRVNTTVVNRTLYLIAFIVILFFFLTLIMIIIINRHYLDKLFLPITQMIAFCEDIKKGSYANLQIESEYEEVSCLASTLNSMSVKLNELINKNLILKVNEANAKLEFYKMQMNPHFLFNTFSMMKTMSELEMNDELQKVISCVITISRYALKNEIEVLFEDEIKCAFDYAEIIKLRYASVFINFDIAEELYKCKIPKFIIQPLLENSVKHGIDNVLRDGDIKIVAFIQNNDVIVQVTDNGIGIKEEKLKSLNDVLLSKIKGSRVDDKIGLRNINERLKLLYGENYGITLNSEYDVYTCVTVKIPKIIYLPEEDENV